MSYLKKSSNRAFTLIELMIVVAIIGVLAAIAVPKFADLVAKSKEAAVKAALGAVRSAIVIYYGDGEGQYPVNMFDSLATNGRYLPTVSGSPSLGRFLIPKSINGNVGHETGFFANASDPAAVEQDSSVTDAPSGSVLEYYTPTVTLPGASISETRIACTHSDSKGATWSTY